MNDVGLTPYLLVAAVLFVCGIVCMASKRNGIGVLVRGERAVRGGERLLFGRKMLRADLA